MAVTVMHSSVHPFTTSAVDRVQPHLGILVPQVKGQLQVGQEVVGELGVHVQHLQDLLPLDGVKVAVAQRSHVRARLPRLGEEVDELAEDVVLAWREQVEEEKEEEKEEEEGEEKWKEEVVAKEEEKEDGGRGRG